MNIIFLQIIRVSLFNILAFLFINIAHAEYPNTSAAVVDFQILLNDSKVAIDANEQIDEIAKSIQADIKKIEESVLTEQKKLIEAEGIMAPEAFESKRIDYEKKVQNLQIKSQESALKIDRMIAVTRAKILDAIKPILEEIALEKGITIMFDSNNVILNADNMDITKEVLKKLNQNLPKIKVEVEE
tara:strand:+ start:429 stop:986 length:558 start_codon:yes stop_codon:yes gene_type:complete